jgi:hypothetical protein
MKLIQRVAWYSGGFIIGIIVLLFFLSGKKTSCDYGPNARTLKNIRSKKLVIPANFRERLSDYELDSTAVIEVLSKGDVLFGESNTAPDTCKVYVIKGELKNNTIKVSLENCEKEAKVTEILVLSNN